MAVGYNQQDPARALIRQYEESEWRSTRLDVLKQLGKFVDSRTYQFLVGIIRKNEDLAEQQLAILAISQRRDEAAASFLRQYYKSAPESLKAHVAYALGQAQDEASVEILLSDFDIAFAGQNNFWLRNIVLALGELKSYAALPKIRRLLTESADPAFVDVSLTMAVLFALGRIERDPTFMSQQEGKFGDDSLLYQVYRMALSQIQIRSQFKLEDYVSKVFTLAEPHPQLPLELRAYDEAEVELSFGLYDLSKCAERMLFALRALKPGKRLSWYEKILRISENITAGSSESNDLTVARFWTALQKDCAHPEILKWALSHEPRGASLQGESLLEARLSWLECVKGEWLKEMPGFLSSASATVGVKALNVWSMAALNFSENDKRAQVEAWSKIPLAEVVYARLLRACAELRIESKTLSERWLKDLEKPALRASALLALENASFDMQGFIKVIQSWSEEDKIALGVRILGVLENNALKLTEANLATSSALVTLLKLYGEHFNIDLKVGALKFLRLKPLPAFEPLILDLCNHQNATVELNAVITLKSYTSSSVASDALIAKLNSPSAVVQGRALDSLCEHASLIAKRAVLKYLKEHLADEFVVDKIYRSFDPQKKGGPEFFAVLEEILQAHPQHEQWEKLVQLRDRLKTTTSGGVAGGTAGTGAAKPAYVKPEVLKELDQKLIEVIPTFLKLDPMAQAALRAAEEPFRSTVEIQNLPIDKAPTVLEYCKALDLLLEKSLGQKYLFPKLETSLHEFQTRWHQIGFMEDYPSSDKVMTALGIKGKMDPDHFPLHKARLMSATFFNGKILQDRFKVFDGLRAWAVIFLVFARKLPSSSGPVAPLLKIPNLTDEDCISVAKRLMVLQDLRNPAAHRQTYIDLATVKVFRNEAIELLNTVLKFNG